MVLRNFTNRFRSWGVRGSVCGLSCCGSFTFGFSSVNGTVGVADGPEIASAFSAEGFGTGLLTGFVVIVLVLFVTGVISDFETV